MDRIFKPPFYERRYIASAPSLSSTAELSKSCGLVGVLDGRVGAARRSQVRAGQEIAPVGRTQSERRRRLALAGGFRLLRSFGIDRLDTPAHGSAGPDDCEISNMILLKNPH